MSRELLHPLLVVAAMLILVPLSDVEGQETTTYHATQRTNVRRGPGTEFDVRNTLSVGQEVPLGPIGPNGWAPIISPTGNPMGYVLARLLTAGAAPEGLRPQPAPPSYGWITGCENGELALETVNIWSTPNKGRVLGSLSGTSRSNLCRGARVEIIGTATDRVGNRQYHIRSTVNGLTGWVTYWFIVRE